MPYVDLLALIDESNLPPGGFDSIRRLALSLHLRAGISVLHAGCNAGFLGRELARRSGCSVTGVDIASSMVAAATDLAERDGLADLVDHQVADVRALPFADSSFDVVVSGGSLAFVEGQHAAVKEWIRVVRPHGLIGSADFYYRSEPPPGLRDQVAEAIGVAVPHYGAVHWEELFVNDQLEPHYVHRGEARTRTAEEIQHYATRMTRHVARQWSSAALSVLCQRLADLFTLFNENMRHLDYVVHIHRRGMDDGEPFLFS